jgi:hypothetical protein
MSGVKIQLSAEEREMVNDPDIILTKNKIIEAVMDMFGGLSEAEVSFLNAHRNRLPEAVFRFPPKISKGEQYRRLPWVMLDLPRVFDPEATLAVRHFFWWGNTFSVAIQATGTFKGLLVKKQDRWPADTLVCVHATPWEHHFDSDNYMPVTAMDRGAWEEQLEQKDFLKLAVAIPVSGWDNAPAFLLRGFRSWMELLLT